VKESFLSFGEAVGPERAAAFSGLREKFRK